MADLTAIVDATVRTERRRIVGGLLRLSGSLDAAEEAFQEAALAAVKAWREEVPSNPGAWLMTAAKNSAKDARRRRAVAESKAPLVAEDDMDARDTIDTVSDDCLRLVFTCCHPELSTDSQVALTLKVVAGFSTEEIARAFVCSEATVSQRILRAKQTIDEKRLAYATPERADLAARLSAALGVLYAMFNEGHTARTGPLMRLDLQAEALRLARLLCDLVPREPEAYGALAIMAFGAARAHTRVDAEGVPILLDAQHRSRWNTELLREGLIALRRARSLGGRGPYVLQAVIAAAHVTAPTWEATDWGAIVVAYDALAEVAPSPVVALNRAIAVSMGAPAPVSPRWRRSRARSRITTSFTRRAQTCSTARGRIRGRTWRERSPWRRTKGRSGSSSAGFATESRGRGHPDSRDGPVTPSFAPASPSSSREPCRPP